MQIFMSMFLCLEKKMNNWKINKNETAMHNEFLKKNIFSKKSQNHKTFSFI